LDVKKRFSEEQIIGFLKQADAGMAVKELCRKYGLSEASYYLWRSKFGGMDVSDAKRLKALESVAAEATRALRRSERVARSPGTGRCKVSSVGHRASTTRESSWMVAASARLVINLSGCS
jgi:putative transposase